MEVLPSLHSHARASSSRSIIDLTSSSSPPPSQVASARRRRSRSASIEFIGQTDGPPPSQRRRIAQSARGSTTPSNTPREEPIFVSSDDEADPAETFGLMLPGPRVGRLTRAQRRRNESARPQANLPGGSNLRILDPAPPPTRSSVGLGGGLISLRRRHPVAQRPRPYDAFESAYLFIQGAPGDLLGRLQQYVGLPPSASTNPTPQSVKGYTSAYTHPPYPRTGFTFDFSLNPNREMSPEPDIGSSKAKQKEEIFHLVCANCPTPLLLAGENRAKVWGLRCGHLICGECLEKIGTPPPSALLPQPEAEASGLVSVVGRALRSRKTTKGKGKGKGKGKEKASLAQTIEHSYACPVSDCGRIHWRVKDDDGKWVGRKKDGEIAVYT
ncbi:hypothetical protein BOTBODRAFT_65161 [Botryobasidium botryosum FD-172 SS1]|uniref:RING-type domain-containing protein n=1 Tax=Botryobasidium botryosum (strain FD-172 SS1) TaxID=930990 RepID=A0A067MWH4_BOTB1|nr:hypothetical protein BOTBODRAFT_65161 [Botryobasidium botryosum FD-172 SS1]